MWPPDFGDYWLTRFLFQRALGLIYVFAFAAAVNQFIPLCGEKGLLPVSDFLRRREFWDAPSLFWLNHSDRFMHLAAWIGLIFSVLAVIGISDSFGIFVSLFVWGSLWVLYMSFVNTGQTFYAFGWETLLLESGFLAIFLGSSDTKPPLIVIWLLRWLLFRLMFGAGLIKIRGDECWRDLTCMRYHYETQPMPNPLSWFFHRLPMPLHKGAVLYNHFVELIVPWGYFIPGMTGAIAGGFTLIFQTLLIVSGNFSWLNFLSLCLSIPCFDDRFLSFLPIHAPQQIYSFAAHKVAVWILGAVVIYLSIAPAKNLVSPGQLMNASFDPLHLVNTYGAFGSITRVRNEIIIEGTASDPEEPDAKWLPYEFRGKPGRPDRMPAQFAPYHLRLDWLMWFAAMGPYSYYRWFPRLMIKLLQGDKGISGLLASNPFENKPPFAVRANLYEYHFTSWEEWRRTGAWWRRELIGQYTPVIALSPKGHRREDAE